MSYLPTQDSLSAAEGEDRDYETLPKSYAKYFGSQKSQAGVPDKATSSLPKSYEKYFKEQPSDISDGYQTPSQALNKAGRLATQGAIGAIQSQTLPYDIPVIAAQTIARNPLIEQVRGAEQKNPELAQQVQSQQSPVIQGLEQKFRQGLEKQDILRKGSKLNQFIQNQGLDVGSLIELAAKQGGVDLTPQDASEMALRWIGFIKNPAKAQELMKNGFNPKNIKEVIKALIPTAQETARGVGAASALQYAAEAEFGPLGTMLMAIVGDIAGKGVVGGVKGAFEFAKHPVESTKRGLAKATASFTPRDKEALQQALIKDFRDAGIQADLGTVSGNNIIKWLQSTLQQSGLTGTPLEEFKKSLSKNIVSEYKKLADTLGESVYESRYEAGEALKSGLQEARDTDLASARELYNSAKERAGESQVFTGNVGKLIEEIENELEPGALKSPEQQKVIDILKTVKEDVLTPEGGIKGARIRSLINDKIALNDIIDYEVQGGAKKLLGRLVGELEKAIVSHGQVDPQFAREWTQANAKFAQHAKTFRGKTISQALKTQDPSLVFSKMNTPHGIEEVRKALNVTPEGRELFKQLSRYKLEDLVGKNMIDGTTNQMKFGTFSKLLEKNQNRQVVKSLLGNEGLQKLERIQKASGQLAETAQKFLNTSRSGVHAGDLALVGKFIGDLANLFAGNPWPVARTVGIYAGSKMAAKFMSDPEFIQLVEDVILAGRGSSETVLQKAGLRLAQKVKSLAEPAGAAIENVPTERQ